MRSEGSVCREPSLRERGSGSHTPCPPKSSPVSIRCSFLLGFGVIFGRSFGHVFFHQAPTERGRKAEPPVLQPLPLTPGRRHPRVSPQLLCISLLHLRPLFHELHVSVQQVQTPLRVPLEYLKLIPQFGAPIHAAPAAADAAAAPGPSKNYFLDSDNLDGVITQLKPDILECEVKWSLGSIITYKASGGDEIPAELFQVLKNYACCESAALNMPVNLENSAVATGLEKVSFHSNPKQRQCQRMLKPPHNCTHFTC